MAAESSEPRFMKEEEESSEEEEEELTPEEQGNQIPVIFHLTPCCLHLFHFSQILL